jgi:hypothetical protein
MALLKDIEPIPSDLIAIHAKRQNWINNMHIDCT